MGLFGLASFIVEKRTKEIGIRKVLGAPLLKILLLLSGEFSWAILLANIIAWPVAFILMNRWLENFAYRINLGFPIFLCSGLLAFFIAMLTVGFHSLRAGVANPVDSLRYE